MKREGGISKAGNRFLRSLAVELAWSWLRYQPQSALAKWYRERFGSGGTRLRRIGIVALARKLLAALWRYLETGIVPEGRCAQGIVALLFLHGLARWTPQRGASNARRKISERTT